MVDPNQFEKLNVFFKKVTIGKAVNTGNPDVDDRLIIKDKTPTLMKVLGNDYQLSSKVKHDGKVDFFKTAKKLYSTGTSLQDSLIVDMDQKEFVVWRSEEYKQNFYNSIQPNNQQQDI